MLKFWEGRCEEEIQWNAHRCSHTQAQSGRRTTKQEAEGGAERMKSGFCCSKCLCSYFRLSSWRPLGKRDVQFFTHTHTPFYYEMF